MSVCPSVNVENSDLNDLNYSNDPNDQMAASFADDWPYGIFVIEVAIYTLTTDLNVRLVVLMRDPRAVRSSRNKRSWCNFAACNSAKVGVIS